MRASTLATTALATAATAVSGSIATDPSSRWYRRAFAVNLALNAGRSWLFWRSRRPWGAAAECAVLAASSADLVRRIGQVSPKAGAVLAPMRCGAASPPC
jgi:translocator protein